MKGKNFPFFVEKSGIHWHVKSATGWVCECDSRKMAVQIRDLMNEAAWKEGLGEIEEAKQQKRRKP